MSNPTIIFEDGQKMVLSPSERITIGRADDNNVIVDDERMSEHHAELILHADGRAELRDKRSESGTFVNKQRIDRHFLVHGDVMAIGPLKATFEREGAPMSKSVLVEEQSALLEKIVAKAEKAQARIDELAARHAQEEARFKKLQSDAAAEEKRLETLCQAAVEAETRAREAKAAASKSDDHVRLAEDKLHRVKANAAQLEASTQAITAEHEQKAAALTKITVEVEKAQARLHEVKERHAAEDERLQTAQEATTDEKHRLDAVQQQRIEIEAALAAQKAETEALKAEAAAAEKAAARSKEESAGLEASRADLTAAISALQARRDQQAAELGRLETETQSAGQKLDEWNARHAAERTRLEQAHQETHAAESKLAAARAELAQIDARVKEAGAQADKQQADARTAQESLTRLQAEILRVETEARTAKDRATARENELKIAEETLARLKSEITRTEETRSGLDARIKELNEEQDKKSAALRQLSVDCDKAHVRLDTLNQSHADEEARFKKLQQDAAAELARLENARKELSQLETRTQEARTAVAKHEEQARVAKEEIAKLEKQRDTLSSITPQLEKAEKRLSEARAAAEKESERHTLLVKQAKEQQAEAKKLGETRDKLEKAEKELAELQKRLAAETARVAEVREMRVATEKEHERLQTAVKKLQKRESRAMTALRLFLFGFPFAVLAAAWWAAEQSQTVRAMRVEGVVAMLKEPMPALHPYAPRTEAERQIIDLVHEPLMRVGADGALQPALAELWRWSQDVTCWFPDEKTARTAQERLQAQIGERNRWAEWRLSTVRVAGSSLSLNFSDPTHAGTPQALEVIADLQPKPIAFWRVETPKALKASAQKFLAESPLAKQVERVWFDRDIALEVVIVGPAQKLIDALRSHLATELKTEVRMGLMAEVNALSEPVLDLDMRRGQTWHDGTPVTAWDVKTSIEEVTRRPWLLPNREALRHIQLMDIQEGGNRLRVVFRSRYGPALCGWAGLPVLPASWWHDHEQDNDLAFTENPPPGAGPFRLTHIDARTLSLTPVSTVAGSPRFLFHFNASPLMTEIGLGTKTTHLIWPASTPDNRHEMLACLTPPHRRLVVLWNTKSPLLSDVRTREAVAMITDVPSIIAALPGKHTLSDASLFPPGMWLHTKAPRVPYDAAKAKKHLADTGWQPGVDGVVRHDGQKLEFSLLIVTGDPVTAQTARLLSEQWAALGAKVQVEALGSADNLAQRLVERKFDAVLLEQRFEVSWDQFPWWHSSQAKPGGTNFAGISDPQTDLLLEALATEFEPEAAGERVRQLEARLLPQRPMLTLFNTVDDAAVRASLVGEQPRTSWTLRQIAFKAKKPAAAPSSLDLKVPDE